MVTDTLFNTIVLVSLGFLVAVTVLGLYRLRYLAGHSILYLVLGAFQYLQTVLASLLYVPVVGGIMVSPGSAVLFPATLFLILLLYLKRDAVEWKRLCVSVALLNVLLFGVSLILSWLDLSSISAPGLNTETKTLVGSVLARLLREDAWIALIGSVLFVLDIAVVLSISDIMSRLFRRRLLFVRVVLPLACGLLTDSAGYAAILDITDRQPFATTIKSHILSKIFASLVFGSVLWAYARQQERIRFTQTPDGNLASDFLLYLFRSGYYSRFRDRITRDKEAPWLLNADLLVDEIGRVRALAIKTGKAFGLMMIRVPGFGHSSESSARQAVAALEEYAHEYGGVTGFRFEPEVLALLFTGEIGENHPATVMSYVNDRIPKQYRASLRFYWQPWDPGQVASVNGSFEPDNFASSLGFWGTVRAALSGWRDRVYRIFFGKLLSPRQILDRVHHSASQSWIASSPTNKLTGQATHDTADNMNENYQDHLDGTAIARDKIVLHELAKRTFREQLPVLLDKNFENHWVAYSGDTLIGDPKPTRIAIYRHCVAAGYKPGDFLLFRVERGAAEDLTVPFDL